MVKLEKKEKPVSIEELMKQSNEMLAKLDRDTAKVKTHIQKMLEAVNKEMAQKIKKQELCIQNLDALLKTLK